MKLTSPTLALFLFTATLVSLRATGVRAADPLQMTFHRQAVRRCVFSNNIPLAELKPAETVALELMHPVMGNPSVPCRYALADGALQIAAPDKPAESSIYIGGAQPFAVYEVAVREVKGATVDHPVEVALEWAALNEKSTVQLVEKFGAADGSLLLRTRKDGDGGEVSELVFPGAALVPPCKLRVQMSGDELAVFAETKGVTAFLGASQGKGQTAGTLDLRDRRVAAGCTFNVAASLPANTSVTLDGASVYLSAGVGQADIRNITHRDGSPFLENNRLWFTFSVRGLAINGSCQGVMSVDPSTFDARLEGIILFDRGDGLLRNDYASHVFYDDETKEWCAFTCCFSRSKDGRGPSGIAAARSLHDPRRGVSVMREELFAKLPAAVEDPCVVYDAEARKWRLLATKLGIFKAVMFESDTWDGQYVSISGPVEHNSTGTLIQRVGGKSYVFSGSSENAIFVYSYPDLQPLGQLKMDLPPFDQHNGARVWPDIVPLPEGYPWRYLALMMDRVNFPGVRTANWSYGALYFYTSGDDEPSPGTGGGGR